MWIESLLHKHSNLGIILSLNLEKGIHVKAPPGVLTTTLRQELKRYKPEIIAYLEKQQQIVQKDIKVQESIPNRINLVCSGNKIKKSEFEERTAIREFDGHLPKPVTEPLAMMDIINVSHGVVTNSKEAEWHDAIKVILERDKPITVTQKTWDAVLFATRDLLHPDSPHLSNMIKYGWSLTDIFGCHKSSIEDRHDHKGVILLLGSRCIDCVSEHSIAIKTCTGAIQTYRRHPLPLTQQRTLMDVNPLLKSYQEITQAGLEKYYWYFEQRLSAYRDQYPPNEIDRQAMNDTVYLFMEDNNLDVTSIRVNQFIKKMVI